MVSTAPNSHSFQLDSSPFVQILHTIHSPLIKSTVVSRLPWTRILEGTRRSFFLKWSTRASSFANGQMFALVPQVQTEVYPSMYVQCISSDGQCWNILQIPRDLNDNDHLEFQIQVVLPRIKSTVETFITYLPLLSQSFGDLHSNLTFNQFAVEGAIQPISCKVWLFIQLHRLGVEGNSFSS